MAAGDNITLNENVNISGDLRVTGTLSALPTASLDQTHLTSTTAIPRTKLAQDNVQGFSIPLHSWRTWDAPTTSLPSAAANDDLVWFMARLELRMILYRRAIARIRQQRDTLEQWRPCRIITKLRKPL